MDETSEIKTEQPETKPGNKNLYYIIFFVISALVVSVGWYATRKEVKNTSENTNVVNTVSPTTGTINGETVDLKKDGEVREIFVEGNEFSFKPASLTLTEGEKVKLTLKNTGRSPHNFVVDDLKIETKTIQGGETDTIEFTAETRNI